LKENTRKLIHPFLLLTAALAALFSSYGVIKFNNRRQSAGRLSQEAHKYLNNSLQIAAKHAASILKDTTPDADRMFDALESGKFSSLREKGIGLSFYKNQRLVFWSQSEVVEKVPGREGLSERLNGGWYLKKFFVARRCTLVYYILLKQEYPINNTYLGDRYPRALQNYTYNILSEPSSEALQIQPNQLSCTLFFMPVDGPKEVRWLLPFALLLLFVYFTTRLLSQLRMVLEARTGKWISWSIYLLLLLLFRYLLLGWKPEWLLSGIDLFNPSHYGNAWVNPSLADLLISIFLLNRVAYEWLTSGLVIIRPSKITSILSLLLFLAIHLMALFFSILLAGLVKDSNINFDFNYLFSFDRFSLVGWIVSGLIFFTFYQVCSLVVKQVGQAETTRDFFLVTLSISAAVFLIVYFSGGKYPEAIIFSTLYILVYRIFESPLFRKENLSRGIIYLLLFSFWGAWILSKENQLRVRNRARILSEKISSERDAIAEFLFGELSRSIEKDSIILEDLSGLQSNHTALFKRMNEKYLNGYWEKFDYKIYVYDTACRLVTKSVNAEFERLDFFEKIYTHSENFSGIPNLYYIPGEGNETRGLLGTCKLNTGTNGQPRRLNLFIELTYKFGSNDIGYPSLLVDKRFTLSDELSNLSYATYKNNLLVNACGDNRLNYPFNTSFIPDRQLSSTFFAHKGFWHYLQKAKKGKIFLVSFPVTSLRDIISLSSYLFILYGLFMLSVLLLGGQLARYYYNLRTLQARIRLIVIGLVILALTGFGAITIIYLINHYREENKDYVFRQLESISKELQNRMGEENVLTPSNSDYNNYILGKVATLFGNDINLYDTTGCISSSSRINLFEEELLPSVLPPLVYRNLIQKHEADFSQDETIGSLPYKSYYVQLRNNNYRLLGYMQLPVFDTQKKLETEIIDLVFSLVNIYVLLFVAAALFSLWISNRITVPLQMLSDRFSSFSLGQANRPVDYSRKDEIGSLISVYNTMVKELEEKAIRLAQQEREGAWKEMAKQVAHEIKNPLTPMKLSVQHLQKSLEEKDENWKSRFDRVARTLIEQIDSLNRIADEFSTFASLERSQPETIDLEPIIYSVAELYKNDESPIHIDITPSVNTKILADKNQLLRIFNNLLKNAVQATEQIPEPRVAVHVTDLPEGRILVEISDNGHGISEQDREKIFTPNFTTKSGGTGLGLAMVKRLAEQNKGKVYFTSAEGKGTSFFLEFPTM
jgi:signal transduction histidine kinase